MTTLKLFEIENIVEETNNGDILYYKVTKELLKFNKNSRSNDDGRDTKRTVQQLSSSTDIRRQR